MSGAMLSNQAVAGKNPPGALDWVASRTEGFRWGVCGGGGDGGDGRGGGGGGGGRQRGGVWEAPEGCWVWVCTCWALAGGRVAGVVDGGGGEKGEKVRGGPGTSLNVVAG